jgi:predicted ABC-type ATPase
VDSVLYVVAGGNGAGKTTYVTRILQPEVNLPFVNADVIAAREWPGQESSHAYSAAGLAAQEREHLLHEGRSFITETVFSHESKHTLIRQAAMLGYIVYLHVIMTPLEVTVHRVAERVALGGHDVPADKIRARYHRLALLIASARRDADHAEFFDNSNPSRPFRQVALYRHGAPVGDPQWPSWTPAPYLH